MAARKTPAPAEPSHPRVRRAALWWLGGFFASTALLAAASRPGYTPDPWSRGLDIGLVVVLVAVTVWLQSKTTERVTLALLWRAYSAAALVAAALIVGIWQYGPTLVLDTFMPGIAWRSWLLLYSLPHLLAALNVGLEAPAPRP
ncbi:MAG: hypothetical protein HYZ26_03480 [Chloroflexi bacterium]|nr:hypothetical protein [Chloroflexota bacterium]